MDLGLDGMMVVVDGGGCDGVGQCLDVSGGEVGGELGFQVRGKKIKKNNAFFYFD